MPRGVSAVLGAIRESARRELRDSCTQTAERQRRSTDDRRARRWKDRTMTSNDLDIEEPGGEREQALRRIKKRRDLGAHLVSYVLVNGALWAIWAATGAGYAWPAWVSGAWGIGLLMNVWEVYLRPPIT